MTHKECRSQTLKRKVTSPPPTTTKDRIHIHCFNCQTKGHCTNTCPLVRKDDGAAPASVVVKDATANVPVTSQFLIAGEPFLHIRK
jgi:hypothetical protein